MYVLRRYLNLGILDRFCHRVITPCLEIMRNWEVWKTNIERSNNHRILQQLAFHVQQTIQGTSVQNLDPCPCSDSSKASISWGRTDVFYPTKWRILNPAKILPVRLPENLWMYQSRPWLDLFNSVYTTFFIMIHTGTICRHVKLIQRLYRLKTGLL